MIYLEDRHKRIIKDILSKYSYTFYAYGSRVSGKHRPFSDLDLCYLEKIPPREIFYIKEAFEESNLPFKVDIVDYNKCSESFQKIIKKDLTRISQTDF